MAEKLRELRGDKVRALVPNQSMQVVRALVPNQSMQVVRALVLNQSMQVVRAHSQYLTKLPAKVGNNT